MKTLASPMLVPRLPIWRSRVLLLILLGWMLGLGGRALYLQGLNNDFLQQKGESRYARLLELPAHRGMISDRNGEPLAVSTPVESVWASPADARLSTSQRRQLARLLGMDEREIARKLADQSREFVYLQRHQPPEVAARVVQLGLPGISLKREYRRYYPDGEVTAQLLGFTRLFNVLGLPTLSVPCGFSTGGLPIGLQVAGRPFDELTILRVAHAYEQQAGWHKHQPAV